MPSTALSLMPMLFSMAALALQGDVRPAEPLGWVRVPAGSFTMGCVPADDRCAADEEPRHVVTISKAFELMAAEVTVGQFRTVIPEVDPQPAWSTTPEHPVVSVTWNEAVDFCRAVGGRLPTESEWEYAARGGKADALYPWGDAAPTDRPGASNGAAFEGDSARPVRTYGSNGFGLYDMAGNVWEWVADFGGFYGPRPETDPTGPDTGSVRVVRGGAYGDDAANLRVSNRTPNGPDRLNVNVGFRCARDLPR